MVWEKLAASYLDIKNIYSVDYYVTDNYTAVKVNKTKLIGKYKTLSAAKEVINGLLIRNGSKDPTQAAFRLNETINYLNANLFTTQNSQTGNAVGSMFTQVAGVVGLPLTNGVIDTTNANYIAISTSTEGTANSRARIINENEAFGTLAADVWRSYLFKTSRFTARVEVPTFNNSLWNSNTCCVGFHGNHFGNVNPNGYNCEKGVIFTPNSLGNWRCRWFQTSDSVNAPFFELAFLDTKIPINTPTNLEILIEDYGKNATWIINGKPYFTVDSVNTHIKTADTGLTIQPIKQVIYSTPTDDIGLVAPPSTGFAAYAGAEVRRRTDTSAQHTIRIYNSKLETIT